MIDKDGNFYQLRPVANFASLRRFIDSKKKPSRQPILIITLPRFNYKKHKSLMAYRSRLASIRRWVIGVYKEGVKDMALEFEKQLIGEFTRAAPIGSD